MLIGGAARVDVLNIDRAIVEQDQTLAEIVGKLQHRSTAIRGMSD
jgi:hypothetical protein